MPLAPHITGKERDAETGLDCFGATCMSPAMGWFASPDAPFVESAELEFVIVTCATIPLGWSMARGARPSQSVVMARCASQYSGFSEFTGLRPKSGPQQKLFTVKVFTNENVSQRTR